MSEIYGHWYLSDFCISFYVLNNWNKAYWVVNVGTKGQDVSYCIRKMKQGPHANNFSWIYASSMEKTRRQTRVLHIDSSLSAGVTRKELNPNEAHDSKFFQVRLSCKKIHLYVQDWNEILLWMLNRYYSLFNSIKYNLQGALEVLKYEAQNCE